MRTLQERWTDDPDDPGRLPPDDPRVQHILVRCAPGEAAIDLGGSFSLNLHLTPSNRVLRIHRPFVSRRRLLAEQGLRQRLAAAGIRTPVALQTGGTSILAAGAGPRRRLAELEPFIDSVKPGLTPESFHWLFQKLGELHTVLAASPSPFPHSVAATWGTPRSMQRWLAVTRHTVATDHAALGIVATTQRLVREIRRRWVPPARLPTQLIHGDFRIGNAVQTPDSRDLILFDTGFAGIQPRVWDVAYALGFMKLALGDTCDRAMCMATIAAYEDALGQPLIADERRAIPAMAAIALLHTVAHAGYMACPIDGVQSQEPFVRAAGHILAADVG